MRLDSHRFGVGMKPQPGHTATELQAGTLAKEPFDVQAD